MRLFGHARSRHDFADITLMTMELQLAPLPGGGFGFGAEVRGVDQAAVARRQQQQASGSDSSSDDDDETAAALRCAMNEHGLLLFRGQTALTPVEQLAFAKMFPWDKAASPTRLSLPSRNGQAFIPAVPEIVVQGLGKVPAENDYGLPAGELRQTQDHWQWHADGLHQLTTPPIHTQMYCTVAPDEGGATAFVSAHVAWERLSAAQQSKAAGLDVHYQTVAHPMSFDGTEALPFAEPGTAASDRGAFGGAAGQWSPADSAGAGEAPAAAGQVAADAVAKAAVEVPWSHDEGQRVTHPLVQVHAETGRPALVAVPMFTHSIDGMGMAESHALLGELLRTGVGGPNGARIYQHAWQPGDLVRPPRSYCQRTPVPYAHSVLAIICHANVVL